MTGVDPQTINPVLCEQEILRLVRLLETATGISAKRARASAEADVAFRGAWARAIGLAEGKTVDLREADATLATLDEYSSKRTAEATLWASTEAGRNIRAQLDALRSVQVNLRASVMQTDGRG